MHKQQIIDHILNTREEIRNQICVVHQEAADRGISAYAMRDPKGEHILAPLLIADAQLLHALAKLSTRETLQM